MLLNVMLELENQLENKEVLLLENLHLLIITINFTKQMSKFILDIWEHKPLIQSALNFIFLVIFKKNQTSNYNLKIIYMFMPAVNNM
jgi:hypothetical protein